MIPFTPDKDEIGGAMPSDDLIARLACGRPLGGVWAFFEDLNRKDIIVGRTRWPGYRTAEFSRPNQLADRKGEHSDCAQ